MVNLKLSVMNNVIKKKLEELIGKEVDITSSYGGVSIIYDPNYPNSSNNYNYLKVIRFEGDDCVVLGKDGETIYVSIDNIPSIHIMK